MSNMIPVVKQANQSIVLPFNDTSLGPSPIHNWRPPWPPEQSQLTASIAQATAKKYPKWRHVT